MPITDDQNLWIARFTNGAATFTTANPEQQLILALAREEIEANNMRNAILNQLHRDIDAIKGEIEAAFIDQIEMKSGEMMDMISTDQTEAFDWWADIKDVAMDKLQVDARDQAMSTAKAKLTMLEQRLLSQQFLWSEINKKNQKVERTKSKALFQDADVKKEIYTPLVREMIIPETFVENKFSEVQEMIDGSNDYYIKELEAVKDTAERDRNIALAADTVTAIASIAASAVDIKGFEKDKAKEIKKYITLGKAAINEGVKLGVALIDQKPQKGCQNFLAKMAKSTGFLIEQITGSEDIGEYVKISMLTTAHLSKLVKQLCEKEKKDNEILETLASMIGDGFDFGSVGEEGEAKTRLMLAKNATMAAVNSAIDAKKANIIKSYKEGDWMVFRTLMLGITGESVKVGFSVQFPKKMEDEGNDEAYDSFFENCKEAVELLEREPIIQNIKESEQEEIDSQSQRAEQLLEEEHQEFEESLVLLGQKEVLDKAEISKISNLIAKLKQDRKIMEAITSAAEGGAKFMKAFCEPLACAGTLVSLLKTAASAQKRSQAMNKWIESSKEALNTMNPYLTSIQNFVEGQRDQYTHYKIKLGILFIQFVSKLVSLAPGLVGAIGKIVDSGAAIAESLEEIIYKYKNRVKLEQAWKITKFALENPENRKANLKARRQNSTLSKYSIAFGAIVAKDVVAIGAMNRIGLNRETLSMPDANVNKVKEYLEERYDEDIQVKRQYTPLRGWASKFPDPELEPRKWMMSIQIASDFGELVNGRSNDISASFQNMRLARDEYDALNTQEEDLTLIGNKLLNRLQKLHESLHAFSPQNEAGSAISEVQTLRDRYIQITTDYATKITLDTTVAEEVDEE